MSHFDPVVVEWLPAELAAQRLGITPDEVIELAGAHRMSRRKRNGEWEYSLAFLLRKLDPNP